MGGQGVSECKAGARVKRSEEPERVANGEEKGENVVGGGEVDGGRVRGSRGSSCAWGFDDGVRGRAKSEMGGNLEG